MRPSNTPKSTARNPLKNISNCQKHRIPRTAVKNNDDTVVAGDAVDRLQFIRSDLSALIVKIDEIIALAISRNTIDRKGSQEIDSFGLMLSDMHSSLKPWYSRLERAISCDATVSDDRNTRYLDKSSGFDEVVPIEKKETELELIVSPSPLVSWRVGSSTVDCGRQLFLLTPLPKSKVLSSKKMGSSKSLAISFADDKKSNFYELPPRLSTDNNVDNKLFGRVEANQAPRNMQTPFSLKQQIVTSECGIVTPLSFSNYKNKTLRLLTPYVPKSSVALDAISESCQQSIPGSSMLRENTCDEIVSDDPKSEDFSKDFAPNFPGLFGFQPKSGFGRHQGVETDETLNWFFSPPKTCVLMETTDGKALPAPSNTGLSIVTPMWKGSENTQRNKQPGEATLKRELWTQFEAVSSSELQFDASVFERTGGKGFLDRLEEVSCETEESNAPTER